MNTPDFMMGVQQLKAVTVIKTTPFAAVVFVFPA
jgi:hypothetical protein